MRPRVRLAAAGITLALAAAACGGAPRRPGAADAGAASRAAAAALKVAPGDATSAPASDAAVSAARSTAEAGASLGRRSGDGRVRSAGGFPLSAEVTPSCVVAGTAGLGRIVTRPKAGLALLVVYSDRERKGPWAFGNAEPSGRYAWTFDVPVDAPLGAATLMVAATDWGGNGGATAERPFTIAGPGGC